MTKKWTPDDMITRERVLTMARSLFPDEEHYVDCKLEQGRIGQPCRVCLSQNLNWLNRLKKVRRSMFVTFGHDPEKYPGPDWMELFPNGVAAE